MTAVMLVAALAAVVPCAADTIRVSDDAGLRRALATAPEDAVVALAAGRYAGPLRLDRRLALVGEGGSEATVVDGGRAGSVVHVTARGARLARLTLRAGGGDFDRDDAGVLVEADSVRLEELEITDVLHGVYLKRASDAVIRGVRIRGRAEVRPNGRGDGIHFYNAMRALAEDNDIADVRDGMYFAYSDTTLVRNNRVARSRYGLHYMFSHANRFENNRFTHSSAGSSIMNSRDVVARGNVFAHNRGVESFGLLQQTTERTLLERNAFVGNDVGLFLDGAVNGEIRDNLVAGNFVGLALFASSTGNRVSGNAIVGNTYEATGGAADSRFCVDGRGNHWGGDRGWDLDRDGVHDVAYSPASPLTELSRERPALRLFLASPAATALSWAERSLPVFRVETVSDDCPLARLAVSVPAPEPPAPPRPGSRAAALLVALSTLSAGAAALGLARGSAA